MTIKDKLQELWPTLEQIMDMFTEVTGWGAQVTLYLTSPTGEVYVATRNENGELVFEHGSVFTEDVEELLDKLGPPDKVIFARPRLTLVRKDDDDES